MTKKKEKKQKRYLVELSEKQLWLLEHCCEQYARMLVGQDTTFIDLFEQAWDNEVRKPQNLEVTGKEFWDMREEVEQCVLRLKSLCFNQSRNANYGVGHNESADILFDMYHTFMHQRWLDMEHDSKELMRHSVMSEAPMRYSSEDLPIVRRIDDKPMDRKSKELSREKKTKTRATDV